MPSQHWASPMPISCEDGGSENLLGTSPNTSYSWASILSGWPWALRPLDRKVLKEDSLSHPEESCKVEASGVTFVLRHVLLVYIIFQKN